MNILNPNRVCPECGHPFKATHGRQAFCCSGHKADFNHFMQRRGQIITPLAQVWRQGKRGTTADRAYALGQLCAYLDLCAAEDKRAGRNPGIVVASKRVSGWMAADLG